MAYHGPAYGMSADIADTLAAKYDTGIEAEVRDWIQKVTGEKIDDFHETLKSGVFLCNFINKIRPDSVKKINKAKAPFVMMENIGNYLAAAASLGMKQVDLFQTVDLYEKKNMTAVLNHLYALGRLCERGLGGYSGPSIGPRAANVDPEKVFGMPN
jgi:hypothetical protein